MDATKKLNGAEVLFGTAQTAGRKSQLPVMSVERDLTLADMEERTIYGAENSERGGLVKLRDTHHKAAKLFADGMSIAYISLKTGYSTATLYTLKSDPAFVELMKFYKTTKIEAYIDTHERLAALANESVGELRDRLDENPADIKTSELLEIAKLGLDRSGHGPTAKQETISATISADDLVRLKEKADRNEKGVKLVEAREEKTSAEDQRPQDSGRLAISVGSGEATIPGGKEVKRQPREREDIREDDQQETEAYGDEGGA